MKYLIVTHHFYPEISPRAFRATELCRELICRGNTVDVVFANNKKIIPSSAIEEYCSTVHNDPQQAQGEKPVKKKPALLALLFRYLFAERYFFTRSHWLKHSIDLTGYSAVISIGTPFYVHTAVARALRNTAARPVAICDNGDPFYNYKNHDKAPYFSLIQKHAFKEFDYVCIPIENAISYYQKYAPRNKIRVIPQGYTVNNIRTAEYRPNEVVTFAFAGRFYEDIRNPESLLLFLETLDMPFRCIFYAPMNGDVYTRVLLPHKAKLGERLVIHEMISRQDCIYELSKADFLINLENTLSVQSPSKIVDYALTGRPILSFSQNAVPVDRFKRWLTGDYIGSMQVDTAKYDIRSIAAQFEHLINSLGETQEDAK